MPLTKEILCRFPAFWFVETGTYTGKAIEIAYGLDFEGIISIELDPTLASHAIKKYMDTDNVWVFQGDSALLLAGILNLKEDSITFWLDAHGLGRLDVDNCPILRELESIVEYAQDHEVNILIDDLRLMSQELRDGIDTLVLRIPNFTRILLDSPIEKQDILAITGEPK